MYSGVPARSTIESMLTPSQRRPCSDGWNGRYTRDPHVIMRRFPPSQRRTRSGLKPTPRMTSDMSADLPAAPPAGIDDLIERCLGRDQAAWDAIVRLHWRKVFNV